MRLENYCMMREDDLMYLLGNVDGAVSQNGYVFIDRGSSVLAVCHADVVSGINIDFAEGFTNRGRHFVTSGALDDRLGIWLLMEIISKRVLVDVLITTGEEIGKSTASEFMVDYGDIKEYNWIVEFDRRGDDYVTYDYSNGDFSRRMKGCGFSEGVGSFSDICCLDGFGVMAFNVGIGYHHEHSIHCYADLDDTMAQVTRFLKFYRKYSGVRFEDEGRLFWDRTSFEDVYEGYNRGSWLDMIDDMIVSKGRKRNRKESIVW